MSIAYTITTSEPVNQQIYRYLRKDIVTCVIHPGSLLSEKEVSARFNVSRQPVREAFIKLAEAGLVQVLPQRGTFVRKISAQRVADGRFIREAVEIAVVRRRAGDRCHRTDGAGTQSAAAASGSGTPRQPAFLALDDEFHRLIAEGIDCLLAWETVENIKATMDRVRFLTLSEVSPPESLIQQHEEIFAALKAKNADAAEKAMRRHLQEMILTITPIAERNSEWFEGP